MGRDASGNFGRDQPKYLYSPLIMGMYLALRMIVLHQHTVRQ